MADWVGHFRFAFYLCIKTRLPGNVLIQPTGSFSCKSNSFSSERFCTRTCFETEAQGNSEMANCLGFLYSFWPLWYDVLGAGLHWTPNVVAMFLQHFLKRRWKEPWLKTNDSQEKFSCESRMIDFIFFFMSRLFVHFFAEWWSCCYRLE